MDFEKKYLDQLSKKDLSILVLLRELNGLYSDYKHQFQGVRKVESALFKLLPGSIIQIRSLTERAEYMKQKGPDRAKFKALLEDYLNHLLGVFNTINSYSNSFFERERKILASSPNSKSNALLTAMEEKLNRIIRLIKEEKVILTRELTAQGWSPNSFQTSALKSLDSIK